MKSLKKLSFVCLMLFLCLNNAFAETCYTPNYGPYECNPTYESYPYPYPDEDWGSSFFGVVIGGGGYYGDGHGGNWHGDHGGRDYHGGRSYHGGGHHHR